MLSDKIYLRTALATGLIFLLINATSSQDVPFCQPQQLQCLHYGSTKGNFCSPLFPFSTTTQVTICGMHNMASVQNLGRCRASRGTSYPIVGLECYFKCLKKLETKHGNTSWLSETLFWSKVRALTLMIEHSVGW